jgi:hypothetical protein
MGRLAGGQEPNEKKCPVQAASIQCWGRVSVGAVSLWPGVTILPSEAMHPAREHWAAKL